MSDDKQNRGPADRTRVNIHEDYEVRHWTKHFGVTAEQLKESVRRVGPMVSDIQRDLGK